MNNRGPRKLPREPHFDTELVQECAVDSKLLEQFDKYRSRLFQTHQIFSEVTSGHGHSVKSENYKSLFPLVQKNAWLYGLVNYIS